MIRTLLLLLCLAAPSLAMGASLESRYAERWSDRADAARTPQARAELAADLLDAAERADDPDYAVLLCMRAYAFGSRQYGSYQTAADALERVQRLAPDRRLECLDRLRHLYDTAYRRSPHKLRLGIGLAEVLTELAAGRRDDALGAFDIGERSAAAVSRELERSAAEIEQATDVVEQVLDRAATDQATARQLGRDQLAAALGDFLAEHRDLRRELAQLRDDYEATRERYRRLAGMIDRFDDEPSPANAQSVAAMYLIVFDQPERIGASVLAAMPGSMSGPARLAAARPTTLDADQALMLCRWYRDLSDRAETDASRQAMLIRARLYADRARTLGDDRAAVLREPIAAALRQAGVDGDVLTDRLAALSARLDAVGRDRPQSERIETADEATDAIADADTDAGDEGPMLTDASDQRVGGRPMTVCETCGRRFFPGWGVEASTCERCRHGHGNIFDFGQ